MRVEYETIIDGKKSFSEPCDFRAGDLVKRQEQATGEAARDKKYAIVRVARVLNA